MKMFVSILAVLACVGVVAQEYTAANEPKIRLSRSEGKNAQVFEQGDEPLPAMAHAGYNAPAGVVLKKNYPDLLASMSFLYYYASQDGMDLASGMRLHGEAYSYTENSQILTQDFDYKPAFKIGVGGNFCEWQLGGEYTWIRQTTNTKSTALVPVPVVAGVGVWAMNNWYVQQEYDLVVPASSVSSQWNLQLDVADLTASRPFYEGRKLVLSPSFGVRIAWIRQTLAIDATISSGFGGATQPTAQSTTNSNSWGVGPRAGFGASALLGFGFHLEGNGAISLLYTEYTTLKHKEQLVYPSLSTPVGTLRSQQGSGTQVIRPELDMSLGFGWGRYLSDQQFHVDFSAAYDFTIFWQQNMMRALVNQQSGASATGATPGNLYLQGLRLTGRFDF